MAEEKTAPSWLFEGSDAPEFSDSDYIINEEFSRIRLMPDRLSEADLVSERETIDACAEKGSLYHYSVKWEPATKSALKEYALVCGMELSKFRAVDPEIVIEANCGLSHQSSDYDSFFQTKLQEKLKENGINSLDDLSEGEQKGFFKEVDKSWKGKGEVTAMLNDPFKIDEKADMSHMEKANWEDSKKQGNMDLRPSMKGGIIPLRGGEDYNKNPETRTVRGQNSIGNEDAIKDLVESEQEDTGVRLRRENEERRNTEAKHQEWERDKIEQIGDVSMVPKGNVFPTESLNAQPGIKGDDPFGLDAVPEKTQGEKIAEANDKRRKAIQGENKEDFKFSSSKAPVRRISDLFGSELKKHLGNEDN